MTVTPATGATPAMGTVVYQRSLNGLTKPASSPVDAATELTPQNNKTANVPSDQATLSIPTALVKKLDTVRVLAQMHEDMNQHIKAVQETNEQLNKSAYQPTVMQRALTTIVKNFPPPFNMDSKERQDLLMSYAAIRQELMKMTIPKPPAPLYQQVKSLWDNTVGQNGQLLASTVPKLSTTSQDSQLKESSSKLSQTSTALTDLSSALANSATVIG